MTDQLDLVTMTTHPANALGLYAPSGSPLLSALDHANCVHKAFSSASNIHET